jgi:protein-arginine deiminase
MWMQDTVEIGYTEMPGSRMHVAFRASRCGDGSCDRFAQTILGKNMGLIAVPVTGATNKGQWDDWFGNVEVTHPVPAWPMGRIYYGTNLSQSWKNFLKSQEIQRPFELDPTWLMIKHIDEIFNFLPGKNGQAVMIATSPAEAAKLNPSLYGAYNKDINSKLEEGIAIAKRELGVNNLEVIRLPQTYSQGGTNDWTSPVNSVYLNGVIAIGNTNGHGPANTLSSTPQGKMIQEKLEKAGYSVRWVNDIGYQPNHGNVHCGTNTRKIPLYDRFWEHLPKL